ncbi:DUF411 domain-containing protein [Henriciella aquimarina]|uniref:DUF411 domain-containing protein n=1 Tax=Henriciella aquimarina TaxID=545261 RepID=UPI0009FE47DA|nr:DUF411 domain-containing protein [Henriciella aquimarina]
MSKLTSLSALGALALATLISGWLVLAMPGRAEAQTVTVHKTPWCGCCSAWASHLRKEGFDIVIREQEDLAPVRARLGVPDALRSCHTGEVDGYAIEGHVPAREIRKLLDERPDAHGLSVPGMPIGSPGMEAGGRVDAYQVLLIGEDGHETYASYPDISAQTSEE